MEMRTLANTDLNVSRACLGTMTFGGQADEPAAASMVDACLERDINFIDTANVYNGGRSEELLGSILRSRRDKLVLASKVGIKMGEGADEVGLSRATILRQAEATLRRLKTDYLDIYYLHQPDYGTPLEESLAALDELVGKGAVRYVGASNYASWQLCRMLWLADKGSGPRVCVAQPMYNLLARGVEQELLPMCRELSLSTVVYNPLAGGLLTGKQKSHAPLPGTRFHENAGYRDRYWHQANFAAIGELTAVARDAGRSLVSLSLGWILHHTRVDGVIIGASRLEQLEENLRAVEEGPLPPEAVTACDAIWESLRGPSPRYNR